MKGFKSPKVLIAYPNVEVKQEWLAELKRLKYTNSSIVFTTYRSLHTHSSGVFDLVILDEVHTLSENQIGVVKEMTRLNPNILGLTGTLSSWTGQKLKKRLGLQVLCEYPIATAIAEKVVTDYRITVKLVPLDDITQNVYKTSTRTEKGQFEAYSRVIRKLETEGKETFYLRLARMRIIQNSISKIRVTKQLLHKFSTDRVLVFCGLVDTADQLGCPVFHNKSRDKQIFSDFAKGRGNHMAVVKLGNTGVTYKPLNKVVVNYFDSNGENMAQKINRCMAMEYNTPGKVSDIWIVSTTEPVELNWLKSALEFFDKNKITFIN